MEANAYMDIKFVSELLRNHMGRVWGVNRVLICVQKKLNVDGLALHIPFMSRMRDFNFRSVRLFYVSNVAVSFYLLLKFIIYFYGLTPHMHFTFMYTSIIHILCYCAAWTYFRTLIG